MKRRDLIVRIGDAARRRGLTWKLTRQGAAHEIWTLGERAITIPRHREIKEGTAQSIMKTFERELGPAMVGDVSRVFTALVEPDHGWWAIRVAELPGVFSQAKRLDKVEALVRDAIGLFLDIPPESFEVVVCERLSPEAQQAVADARRARTDAVERQKVASEQIRHAVGVLTQLGLPQRDIGRLLDVSHQRVGQLRRPRASARRP